MNLNRRLIVAWVLALVSVDVLLTWISYRNGTLSHGRSPILDVWDTLKALTLGGVLLVTARRVGSRGLAAVGIAAVLVGLVGGSPVHGTIAGWLLPGAGSGIGKFLILSTAVVVVIVVLYTVRDPWPHFPAVRRTAVVLLLALLFSAGILDLVGGFRGSAVLEESAERLVMSTALALTLSVEREGTTRSEGGQDNEHG